jgi:hypothetical protein
MALDLSLGELQSWMHGVVVAPGAIAEALSSRDAAARVPVERIEEVILPTRALTSADRLQIYQGMYPMRMEEALASDYPALKHFLGDHGFLELVTAYVASHPSRAFTLNRLGASMADFVRDGSGLRRREYLHDLARLEWAIARSFDAPESEVLTAEDAARVPQEAWEGARLVPTPSFALLSFRHDVAGYLDTVEDEEHRHPPARRKDTWVAVYRRDYRVFHLALARPAFGLLGDLAAGTRLGDALQAAMTRPGRRPAPDRLFGWFRSWVSEGMFRAVELPGSGT